MKKKRGFTLVEIMIVVVIIGLLATMALPAFNRVRRTAQTNAVRNNLRQISNGADQYYLANGVQSVTEAQLVGPNEIIKSLTPIASENYSALFPLDQANSSSLTINVPGLNTTVTYGN